ncbi:RNA polymerase sigma factor [uncultured Desulfobacterium sp.]|uniref:RNA polymerase sigma factor n=1 Tax=uncultured Desulfobacterium sp. TaxID=201089 RepID=A0A445MQK0_9BACT|nr:RNA polymerase sigma factor [uncultured Desulfobacterium sp.]
MQQSDQQRHAGKANASVHIELVEKARAGNRLAFEKLADLFHHDVFRMVYFRTRSQMDAEDLTQDIFLQAFKSLPELKSVDRFKSWLFSIAVNRVRDFHRRKRIQRLFNFSSVIQKDNDEGSGTQEKPDQLDNLISLDFWKKVELILKGFPAMEREVFILRFMDQLEIKEISQILKKDQSTIKTHLYRALKKFRGSSVILEYFEGDKT